MANARTSEDYREQAVIDTKPVAAGYFTNAINPRMLNKGITNKGAKKIYYSVRGSVNKVVVTLQFKTKGESDFSDFKEIRGAVMELLNDDRSGTQWRIGVKRADWLSGSVTVGFNW